MRLAQPRLDIGPFTDDIAAGVPPRPTSGITGLTVAVEGRRGHWAGEHPGGNKVELVPPGTGGVSGIGITLSSADPERLASPASASLPTRTATGSRFQPGPR